MRGLIILLLFFASFHSYAQELKAVVIINAEQTGKADLQVFKTLERSLTEFINNTRWTDRDFKQQERIDCSFNIIVSEVDSNSFLATVQVQSARPIYGSDYTSPVFNYNDRSFNFNYTEFQPLIFNPNSFDSNLVSVMAFYAYTIIGFDANSFKQADGIKYFQTARQIVTTAAPSNERGWNASDGAQSRFRLNEDLLSPNFKEFSNVIYDYHRKGLDLMSFDVKLSKNNIAEAVIQLKEMYKRRPNNFLTRVFFDSKAEEITSIFSGGPQVNIVDLLETLNRISPTKSTFWRQIKF